MGTGFANLTTRTKVEIASAVSAILRGGLRFVGREPVLSVRRSGLNWQLDLREGIDLALFLGIYEPHIARALPKVVRQGDIVIDVGANIGAQALPLAHLVADTGRLVAVEPTGFAFRKLNANLGLNPELAARTTAVQAMLGPDNMELEAAIPSSWPLTGDRSAVDNEFAGLAQSTEGAKALSLDQLVKDLGLDRVDLIKIDVDGYEGDVLSGASWTTQSFAPKIIMEIAPYLHEKRPGGFAGLLDQIASLGYGMHDLATGAPITADPALFDTTSQSGFDVLLERTKTDRPGSETGGL